MRVRGTSLVIMMLLVSSVLILSLPTVSSPRERRVADLVETADLVAVADVVAVTDPPATASDRPFDASIGIPRVAVLEPVTVWKGEEAGTIEVPFTECLGPPAGPNYEEGDRVIVFLGKSGDTWTTIDLAKVPVDSVWDPLESFDPDLLGHGPGATCLPGLPVRR